MVTGKLISGFFGDTTGTTLGNNKNSNKGESICAPNSGSTRKVKREVEVVQLVPGEGRDGDRERSSGVTTVIPKNSK